MPVNRKVLFAILPLLFCLTGCGAVEFVDSPESWGKQGGEYGSTEWVKLNGAGTYPNENGVAMYCVTVGEDGQKKYGWNIEQAMSSTDACVTAFVAGLAR